MWPSEGFSRYKRHMKVRTAAAPRAVIKQPRLPPCSRLPVRLFCRPGLPCICCPYGGTWACTPSLKHTFSVVLHTVLIDSRRRQQYDLRLVHLLDVEVSSTVTVDWGLRINLMLQ